MMELAHSLLLNEEALQKIPDNKKPVFVFEWLRFLDKVLSAAQKVIFTPLLVINLVKRYLPSSHFSSPEQEVVKVSYLDQSMSGVNNLLK